jgi:hypothetical protein
MIRVIFGEMVERHLVSGKEGLPVRIACFNKIRTGISHTFYKFYPPAVFFRVFPDSVSGFLKFIF